MNFKPIIYNGVPKQSLYNPNQLTVQSWNKIINSLSEQGNANATELKELRELLFGYGVSNINYDWYDNISIITSIQRQLVELRTYTDNKFTEAKTYTDDKLTEAKVYTDDKLAEAKTYTNSKFTEAKTYTDEKLVEAKTYTDEKLVEAETYTDSKFTEAEAYTDNKVDLLEELNSKLSAKIQTIDNKVRDIDDYTIPPSITYNCYKFNFATESDDRKDYMVALFLNMPQLKGQKIDIENMPLIDVLNRLLDTFDGNTDICEFDILPFIDIRGFVYELNEDGNIRRVYNIIGISYTYINVGQGQFVAYLKYIVNNEIRELILYRYALDANGVYHQQSNPIFYNEKQYSIIAYPTEFKKDNW